VSARAIHGVAGFGRHGEPFRSAGLWRRIRLYPGAGSISAGLEDDLHRFALRLDHEGERITALAARAERIPWSTCPGAAEHLAQHAVGRCLEDIATLEPLSHCTHLLDLAILCAAHARDGAPICFDMWVADRIAGRSEAVLAENGEMLIRWALDGTVIEASDTSDDWCGRDLRRLSTWKHDLALDRAERATLLRRAIFISGGRDPALPIPASAIDRGPERLGVCFTYQMPHAEQARLTPAWRRDFTRSGTEPLQGFAPHWR
jgi:hypothetical protein